MSNYYFKRKKAFIALLAFCGLVVAVPSMASSEGSVIEVHNVQQQTYKLKGVVKDEAGNPIIGASVVEKEKPSNGTITEYYTIISFRICIIRWEIIKYIFYIITCI